METFVEVDIVFLKQIDFVNYLLEKTDPENEIYINFLLSKKFGDKYLTQFKISYTDNNQYKEITDLIEYISKDTDTVDSVTVYYNSYSLEKNERYFKEIYELEFMLRRFFTYIFTVNYPNDTIYSIKKRFNIDTIKEVDNYTDEDYKSSYTNPLFYGTFKQYEKLTHFHSLNSLVNINKQHREEKLADLKKYSSLESFYNFLEKSFIPNEKHRNIVESLSNHIGRLEHFRNIIAHNNICSKEEETDFEIVKKELCEQIESFWQGEGEKSELITKLKQSNSFSETHYYIEKLFSFLDDFSIVDINNIIDAYIGNDQIYRILTDADVKGFIMKIYSVHFEKITPERQDKIKVLLEDSGIPVGTKI